MSTSYTASMAARPDHRARRTAAAAMSSSPAADRLLGVLSVPYTVLAFASFISMMLVVLPLFFLEIRRHQKGTNISTQEGGSKTAIKTLAGRAVTAACGYGPDRLAPLLVRHRSLMGDGPVGLWFWRLYLRSLVFGFRLNRRIYTEQLVALVYRQRLPIADISYIHVRTCWLDDMVDQFVADRDGAPGQLVVLGAGYDLRSARMDLASPITCFEVDAPGTQDAKRALLQQLGIAEGDTRYVPCDFATESWLARLEEAGFDRSVPACIVWEGVTMYLDPEQVAANLELVAGLAPGSVVGFDVFGPWSQAEWLRKASARSGEPFLFALADAEVEPFVQEQGLAVWDHLGHQPVKARYLPHGPGGREAGLCGDFGAFVVAGVEG